LLPAYSEQLRSVSDSHLAPRTSLCNATLFLRKMVISKLLAYLYWQLQDTSLWTIGNVTGALGVAAAVIALAPAYWDMYQQRRTQRLLERDFGADFYQPSEIERAIRYYVQPDCSSVDPAQEVELRQVIATKENLFDAIDRYVIHDSARRHIMLLADSGMGKTSFMLNYYARNQRLPRRKRQRLAVIPLGHPDAMAEIAKINNQRNTVLFLDAFDEDTKAIQDYRARLAELMHASGKFKCVLITCRTQFFLRDDEIPRQAGLFTFEPRKPGESGIFEFWKLYIMPLNDGQVERFLRRRYPIWKWKMRKRARAAVGKVPLLSVRPMLLAYIPDLLESGEQESRFAVQLYDNMVDRWLEREQRWVDKKELEPFSEGLAVDLYVKRAQRGAERVSREELGDLLKAHPIPIDEWKITGRSLLNRDGLGHFKFAHRSIMEHLFVRRFFAGDERCRNIEWTDLMKQFCLERIYLHYERGSQRPLSLAGADLTNTESISVPALYHLRTKPVMVESPSAGPITAQTHPLVHIFALQQRSDAQLVTDHATGLTWQQTSPTNMRRFEEALRYVEELNATHYCGYSDWRLPTADELVLTMGGMENSHAPFEQVHFTYWTSDKTTRGRGIYYLYTQLRVQAADSTAYVRAVRSLSTTLAETSATSPLGQPKVLVARA
jgi:Protein of unknown function (DUF1566)